MKQFTTVEEAQKVLPEIQTSIGKIRKLQFALHRMQDIDIEYTDDYERLEHDTNHSLKWHELNLKLYQELQSLLKVGCIIKDIRIGLIDFYSMFEGREIFLCYRLGEENISHWHEVNEGFSGRKPIEELESQML